MISLAGMVHLSKTPVTVRLFEYEKTLKCTQVIVIHFRSSGHAVWLYHRFAVNRQDRFV